MARIQIFQKVDDCKVTIIDENGKFHGIPVDDINVYENPAVVDGIIIEAIRKGVHVLSHPFRQFAYDANLEELSVADELGVVYATKDDFINVVQAFKCASGTGGGGGSCDSCGEAIHYIQEESQLQVSGDDLYYELLDGKYQFMSFNTVLTRPFKQIGTHTTICGFGIGTTFLDATALDSDVQGAFYQSNINGSTLKICDIRIAGNANADFLDLSASVTQLGLTIENCAIGIGGRFRDLGSLNNIRTVQVDNTTLYFENTGFNVTGNFRIFLLKNCDVKGQSAVNSAFFYTTSSASIVTKFKVEDFLFFENLDFGINLPTSAFVTQQGLHIKSTRFDSVNSPIVADQSDIRVYIENSRGVGDVVTPLINTSVEITMTNTANSVTSFPVVGQWRDLQWNAGVTYTDATWLKGATLVPSLRGVTFVSAIKTRLSLRLNGSFFAVDDRVYQLKAVINNTDSLGNITSLAHEEVFPHFQTIAGSALISPPSAEITYLLEIDQHVSFQVRQVAGVASNLNFTQYSRLIVK